MLIIRLQRVGKKNEPTFRIVLTDSKNSAKKNGKFTEILGSYDARDKNVTKIDAERAKYWISQGAQVSDTVRNFLITKGVIEGKKVNALPKKSPIKKEGEEETVADAPVAEEAPKAEVVDEAPSEESTTEKTPVEEEKAAE